MLIDITGKTTDNGQVHDRYLGLSQVYSPGFNQTYGVNGSDTIGHAVCQTNDGGYLLAGLSENLTTYHDDIFIVKTDANGQLLWNKTFVSEDDSVASAVLPTSDGGYVLGGYTYVQIDNETSREGLFVMKIDAVGNLLWTKSYTGSSDWYGSAFIQTNDGGYAFLGTEYNYTSTVDTEFALVLKIDATGNAQWNKTYQPSAQINYTSADSIIQVADGYVIGGSAYVFDPATNDTVNQLWLFKINLTGNLTWSKNYQQLGSNDHYTSKVFQAADGGYVIAGHTELYEDDIQSSNIFLVKTDAAGTLLWNKTSTVSTFTLPEDFDYDTSTVDIDFYMQQSAISTFDGGYMFAGILENLKLQNGSLSLSVQSIAIKTDAQGNILWTKTYGDLGNYTKFSIVYDLIQTRDGGFALVGYYTNSFFDEASDTSTQMLLIKTAVNGEVGLAMTGSTANSVTLYRGDSDPYWNYVRVRIWVIK